MSKRFLTVLGGVLVAISVTLFAAAPVLAADLRSGDTITVASGEVINDDLYIAGESIVIDGTINGDLWAVGREVTVNGTVNGSIVAAAETINVNGDVAHAARLAGETLNIRGDVGGDLIAFCSAANIANTAEIGGDLLVGAGNVRIDALIEGDVKGGAGEVTITNGVRGNVELEVDNLTVASTANIEGDLTYTSENEAEIESGAQVGGTTTHQPVEEEPAKAALGAGIAATAMGKVVAFLMILVVGIIIILIMPRRIVSMADSIRMYPLPSLGWGAVILFATPIAAIIVCFTVIGIPVGLIALAVYGIAIYLSQIPVALLIGRLIIRRSTEMESKGLLVGALALGLVILGILRLIPFLGFWVGLATALFGLGAVVVSEKRLQAEA